MVRLALAAVFIPTGLGKFVNHDAYVERFERWGFGAAAGEVAIVVGVVEVVCGIGLALGVAPRALGLILAGNMVGALATAGRIDGGQDVWLPLVLHRPARGDRPLGRGAPLLGKMDRVLEIEGLTKRYGEQVALDGLTMSVPPGQVVGLLGPNGSGKTTAMRIVFGVIPADAGTVRYRGEPVGIEQRRRFGYMPEERGLYPDMRVLDQLVYLARLAGVSKRDATARAGALLERLGLSDRAGDPVERLSLGNQQRVQLAAALVHEPEALVLDEPFSGLDPLAVASLSEIVQEAARAGPDGALLQPPARPGGGPVRVGGGARQGAPADGGPGERPEVRRAAAASCAWTSRARRRASASRRLPGVRVTSSDAGGLRLALAPGVDPLELLDTARAAGRVRDFGLEQPTLAELFLDAVNGHR